MAEERDTSHATPPRGGGGGGAKVSDGALVGGAAAAASAAAAAVTPVAAAPVVVAPAPLPQVEQNLPEPEPVIEYSVEELLEQHQELVDNMLNEVWIDAGFFSGGFWIWCDFRVWRDRIGGGAFSS